MKYRETRYPSDYDIRVRTESGRTIAARIHNVSPTGALVSGLTVLPGETLQLEILGMVLRGRVMRLAGSRFCSGCCDALVGWAGAAGCCSAHGVWVGLLCQSGSLLTDDLSELPFCDLHSIPLF